MKTSDLQLKAKIMYLLRLVHEIVYANAEVMLN